jgi:2-aminoethylphosphonate-pyruvate transaminase
MLRDWCTWDDDYNLGVVTPIREGLIDLATATRPQDYTAVLMQGSGTFSVEAMIGTAIPRDGRLLVLANGEYGNRLGRIAITLGIDTVIHDSGELAPPDLGKLDAELSGDPTITHVVCVHNETTTGMINPLEAIARIVKRHERIFLVDSMSAFGGMPLDVAELGIDFLVSSANKCIEGVPGFSFALCARDRLEACGAPGQARSLALDLHAQWAGLQATGEFRFTPPVHALLAFRQALDELEAEGGPAGRLARYEANAAALLRGMAELGFAPYVAAPHQVTSVDGVTMATLQPPRQLLRVVAARGVAAAWELEADRALLEAAMAS